MIHSVGRPALEPMPPEFGSEARPIRQPGEGDVPIRGYLQLPQVADAIGARVSGNNESIARTCSVTAIWFGMHAAICAMQLLGNVLAISSAMQVLVPAIAIGTCLWVAREVYWRGKTSIGEIMTSALPYSLYLMFCHMSSLAGVFAAPHPVLKVAFLIKAAAGYAIAYVAPPAVKSCLDLLGPAILAALGAKLCLAVGENRRAEDRCVQQKLPNFRAPDPWWQASMELAAREPQEIVHRGKMVKWVTDPARLEGDDEAFCRSAIKEATDLVHWLDADDPRRGERQGVMPYDEAGQAANVISATEQQREGVTTWVAPNLYSQRLEVRLCLDQYQGRYETLIGALMEHAGSLEFGARRAAFVDLGFQLAVQFSRLRHIWLVAWDPAVTESKLLATQEHDQMWLLIKAIRTFHHPWVPFDPEHEAAIVDAERNPEIASAMRCLLRTVLKTLSCHDFDRICLQQNDRVGSLRPIWQARSQKAVEIVLRGLRENHHLLPGMPEGIRLYYVPGDGVVPTGIVENGRAALEEALRPCLQKHAEALVSMGLFDELDAVTDVAVVLQDLQGEQLPADNQEYDPLAPQPWPLVALRDIVRRQTEVHIVDAETTPPDPYAIADDQWVQRAQAEERRRVQPQDDVFYITA
ncbi:MAG: hypothetical protein ACOYKZ_07655 [Chlamydiia bacterium]